MPEAWVYAVRNVDSVIVASISIFDPATPHTLKKAQAAFDEIRDRWDGPSSCQPHFFTADPQPYVKAVVY